MASFAVKLNCKYHPNSLLVEDAHAGDMVCSTCGLVVGDRVIDVGTEWRTFQNDTNDRSRVGGPENQLLDGGELSTMIANTGKFTDESGKPLYKNKRNLTASDRNMISAFRDIGHMCDRLRVTKSVADRANAYYKMVHDAGTLKGRSVEAVLASCIHLACRSESAPRTFKEVCAVANVSKKEIGQAFKQLCMIVKQHDKDKFAAAATQGAGAGAGPSGAGSSSSRGASAATPGSSGAAGGHVPPKSGPAHNVVNAASFLSRFCANLQLPTALENVAVHVAQRAMETGALTGRSPLSIAAAAIYMTTQASAAEHHKTMKQIGEVSGVAEVTIKQAYKLMLPLVKKLFPADFKPATPLDMLPSN